MDMSYCSIDIYFFLEIAIALFKALFKLENTEQFIGVYNVKTGFPKCILNLKFNHIFIGIRPYSSFNHLK